MCILLDVDLGSSVPLYRRVLRSGESVGTSEHKEATVPRSRSDWSRPAGLKKMDLALQDITEKNMTFREAEKLYGISKSTLHDHASGKVRAGASIGAPKYFSDEEEDEIVHWLEGCAEVGCAKNIKDVRAVVGAILAKQMGVECSSVSHGWWDRFRKRHPHLRLRAGEALAYRRAIAASPDTVRNYFDQLEEILVTNSLHNQPSRIYNIDESGFPLNHHPGKRIGIRGQKHVTVNTSGDKTLVTVLAASMQVDAISCLW